MPSDQQYRKMQQLMRLSAAEAPTVAGVKAASLPSLKAGTLFDLAKFTPGQIDIRGCSVRVGADPVFSGLHICSKGRDYCFVLLSKHRGQSGSRNENNAAGVWNLSEWFRLSTCAGI